MTKTTHAASTSSYLKLDGDLFKPEEEEQFTGEGPIPTRSELWGGYLVCSYEYKDGSEGFSITNGSCSIHMDNTNNMVLSAGNPGQAGCGGKLVVNTGDQLQKSSAFAMEITGKENGGLTNTEEGSDGNVEETVEPPYSLKVYGDVLIECVGGDVKLKGDNVQINASNNLTLSSGKDVNIQAGVNGGNINLSGGNVKIDTGFLEKKVSGGEYTDGAGEVQTDQIKLGSTNTINTIGDINRTITGNYTCGITGDLKLGSKNMHLAAATDFALEGLTMSTRVTGQAKTEILGLIPEGATQKENWNITVGPVLKPPKGVRGIEVNSTSGVGMFAAKEGFDFSVGKALSSLKLTEKDASLQALELNTLDINTLGISMAATKTSNFKLGPESATIIAPAIFLN